MTKPRPPWPPPDEQTCARCGHWRCSHDQDETIGTCYYRIGDRVAPGLCRRRLPDPDALVLFCPCRGWR